MRQNPRNTALKTSHTFFAAMVVAGLMLSSPFWSTSPAFADPALEAFNNKEYVTAYRLWTERAKSGEAEAQYRVGTIYVKGLGRPKDAYQARDWFQQAALQGHGAARFSLAMTYYVKKPNSDEQDVTVHWLRAAADSGEGRAAYVLALINGKGWGSLEKSKVRAYLYAFYGAKLGNAKSAKLAKGLEKELYSAQIDGIRKMIADRNTELLKDLEESAQRLDIPVAGR